MRISIRLIKRDVVRAWDRIIITAISIVVAFLLIGIMIQLMGFDAIASYRFMFKGAYGTFYNFSESVLQSIPLIVASLGVAVALTMSTMNIGAEGQYTVGAWAATAVALFVPGIPAPLVLPAIMLAGFLAGALWGMIAIFPTVKWGVGETITTLMFNYIALHWNNHWVFGPWRDTKSANLPVSPLFPKQALFQTFFNTRVNTGLIIGIALAILLHFFLNKSALGYQIKVIGQNKKAALYAGMNANRTMLFVMMVSGGLAGLAGVTRISGSGGRLIQNIAGGDGYTAIIISRLAKNNPLVIVIISLLFGGLNQGAFCLQLARVPFQVIDMLKGAILFCALAGELFVENKLHVSVQRRSSRHANLNKKETNKC